MALQALNSNRKSASLQAKMLKNEDGFLKAVLFHEAPRIIMVVLIHVFKNQHLMMTGSKRLTESDTNCG